MNNSPWVDILPPVTPTDNTSTLFILASVLLLFLLVIIVYLWRNSVKQKCLRELLDLLRKLPETTASKNIPFQINRMFRQCFNVINIDHIVMPDENNWKRFKDKLRTACYTKNILTQQELEKLLVESRYWITQRASKND